MNWGVTVWGMKPLYHLVVGHQYKVHYLTVSNLTSVHRHTSYKQLCLKRKKKQNCMEKLLSLSFTCFFTIGGGGGAASRINQHKSRFLAAALRQRLYNTIIVSGGFGSVISTILLVLTKSHAAHCISRWRGTLTSSMITFLNCANSALGIKHLIALQFQCNRKWRVN